MNEIPLESSVPIVEREVGELEEFVVVRYEFGEVPQPSTDTRSLLAVTEILALNRLIAQHGLEVVGSNSGDLSKFVAGIKIIHPLTAKAATVYPREATDTLMDRTGAVTELEDELSEVPRGLRDLKLEQVSFTEMVVKINNPTILRRILRTLAGRQHDMTHGLSTAVSVVSIMEKKGPEVLKGDMEGMLISGLTKMVDQVDKGFRMLESDYLESDAVQMKPYVVENWVKEHIDEMVKQQMTAVCQEWGMETFNVNIDCDFQADRECGFVAVQDLIERLVNNAVNNAIKSNLSLDEEARRKNEGMNLRLSTHTSDKYFHLVVTNSGANIPERFVEKGFTQVGDTQWGEEQPVSQLTGQGGLGERKGHGDAMADIASKVEQIRIGDRVGVITVDYPTEGTGAVIGLCLPRV